jgi:hypothetical protein
MTSGTISGNSSYKNGGGVYIIGSKNLGGNKALVSGGLIENNKAGWNGTAYMSSGGGGGIAVLGSDIDLNSPGVKIKANGAPYGGGVYLAPNSSDPPVVTMNGGHICENTAGGGVYLDANSSTTSVTFTGGTDTNSGEIMENTDGNVVKGGTYSTSKALYTKNNVKVGGEGDPDNCTDS